MIHVKTYNDFLLESRGHRTRRITKTKAIELYKENCKEYSEYKPMIYRGLDTLPGDYGYFEPKSRYSDNKWYETTRLHNLIIDNAPNWKEYPSRKLICSTSRGNAAEYGTLCIVIPYDDAVFGVSPTSDIWTSFSKGISAIGCELSKGRDVMDFNRMIQDIGKHEYMDTKKKTGIRSYEDLVEYCQFIDGHMAEFFQYHDYKLEDESKFKNKCKKYGTLNTICKAIDPVINHFRLCKISDVKRFEGKPLEIWTDSFCLIISEDKYTDFLGVL